MTFNEYQTECLRTASMSLGADLEMCIRALGLCGEAVEFREALAFGTVDDEVKEGGDVLWYAAALASAYKLTGDDLLIGELSGLGRYPNDTGAAARIMAGAARLAELTKKQVGHKKPANREQVIGLLQCLLIDLAGACPIPFGDVAERNVLKLRERYPDGFKPAAQVASPAGLAVDLTSGF